MSLFARNSDTTGAEGPEAQAARWLARQQLGFASREENAEFERWRQQPGNAAAWEEASHILESIKPAASRPGIVAMRTEALSHARQTPLLLGNVPARIAAAILIGIGIAAFAWLRFDAARELAPPTASQSRLASKLPSAEALMPSSFETRRGERRTVALPDGSRLSLNTASRAEAIFSADQRIIRLTRGQAFFSVAPDRSRPFKVVAGNLQVTALGTRFDVRVYPQGSRVVLVEGKVRVEPLQRHGLGRVFPSLEQHELISGQQLVANEHAEIAVAVADLEQSMSWQSGRLVFRDQPLADAVAEVNRYGERQLIIADPELSKLPVSGVFSTEHPENFIAAVATFYPVRIEERSPNLTVLHLKSK